jgi:hypothetical protein
VRRYFSSQEQNAAIEKTKVYDTIIPRNIRLTEAPGFGKPIFLYDKQSVGAQRYGELANEMLGIKSKILEYEKGSSEKTEIGMPTNTSLETGQSM